MDNWCCLRVSSLNKTGWDGHSWEQESIFILAIKDSAPGTGARRLKKGKHVLSQAVLWLRSCLRETKAEQGSQRKTSIINTVWCHTQSWWTNSSETTLKEKLISHWTKFSLFIIYYLTLIDYDSNPLNNWTRQAPDCFSFFSAQYSHRFAPQMTQMNEIICFIDIWINI